MRARKLTPSARVLSFSAALIIYLSAGVVLSQTVVKYPIVDTGQEKFFGNTTEIAQPSTGTPFYGQDAEYLGLQPAYQDNGDGTVTDLNTGLMWQKTPDLDILSTFADAVAGAGTFNLAGYTDWRFPTIKELYSLIDFRGSSFSRIPYIDTDYFDFRFGDESAGERLIDAQYWSSTEYVGTTMNGDPTVFGVNFADGRIKGYPRDTGPGGLPATHFVRYVRGNPDYGVNNFLDLGDGTVTDIATGLQWQTSDDGIERNWEEALGYAQSLTLGGYDDWRLPNAKELQSILDYSKAPDATEPARREPAIDTDYFQLTETESWFWTGTTHLDAPNPNFAVYICFGQAYGYMTDPFGNTAYMNVHGAGAQRSDPKSGNPDDWAGGHGPQGDEVRIYNYVRCVRGGDVSALGLNDGGQSEVPSTFELGQNYPNPFNPSTTIPFSVPESGRVTLKVFNLLAEEVATLLDGSRAAGRGSVVFSVNEPGGRGKPLPSGVYFYRLTAGNLVQTRRMVLLQ